MKDGGVLLLKEDNTTYRRHIEYWNEVYKGSKLGTMQLIQKPVQIACSTLAMANIGQKVRNM